MGSIVVGIDGSEGSRHALEWAVTEAQLRQAHLDIVSCWEYPMLIASEVMWAPPPNRNDLVAAAATRANMFIEQLQLDETDLSFDVLTPEGRPGAELVRIAAATEAEGRRSRCCSVLCRTIARITAAARSQLFGRSHRHTPDRFAASFQ